MRNLFFKSFTILFAASALMLSSCSKDGSTSTIVGVWIASSLTADEVEMMDSFFSSVQISFGDMENNSGTFSITGNIIGIGPDTETGTYVMDATASTVTVTADNETTVYTFDLDGNVLVMTGTDDDNIDYVISCNRE